MIRASNIIIGGVFLFSVLFFLVFVILAVLGAYYISDIVTTFFCGQHKNKNYIILLCANDVQKTWHSVLDVKRRQKNAKIVVFYSEEHMKIKNNLQDILSDVEFATKNTLAEVVSKCLST